MIFPRSQTFNTPRVGPLVAKYPDIEEYPNHPDRFLYMQERFVVKELPGILEEWAHDSQPIFTSDQDAMDHALDALAVAKCWLWIVRNDDLNTRPEVMCRLTKELESSCDDVVTFVPAFINEGGVGNFPAQMALAMMISRMKTDIMVAYGWE